MIFFYLNNSMLEYRKSCGLNKTELKHSYAFSQKLRRLVGLMGCLHRYIDTYIISFLFVDNNIE